jgi:AcrR family transcriptional regulator
MSASTSLNEVRDGIRASLDPRARRTRSRLLEATKDLLVSGSTDVTVTAITRAARVSRSVFYTHFSSLDDLAATLLEAAVDEIGSDDAALRRSSELAAGVPVHIAVARSVAHADTHRALYAAAFAPTGTAFDRAVDAYMRQVLITIDASAGAPGNLDRLAMARFIASGSLSVLITWLRDDNGTSTDEITELLVAMLPPWFSDKA